MANKLPKPQKPSYKEKQAAKKAEYQSRLNNPLISAANQDSLFAQSQRYIQENKDAQPFKDFAYAIFAVLAFFLWRLWAAVSGGSANGVSVWGFLTLAMVVLLNVWTGFLVLICVKRKGDVGIVRIQSEDLIRFMGLSGVWGAWFSILYYNYKSEDPKFIQKAVLATVVNLFWPAVYIRFIM